MHDLHLYPGAIGSLIAFWTTNCLFQEECTKSNPDSLQLPFSGVAHIYYTAEILHPYRVRSRIKHELLLSQFCSSKNCTEQTFSSVQALGVVEGKEEWKFVKYFHEFQRLSHWQPLVLVLGGVFTLHARPCSDFLTLLCTVPCTLVQKAPVPDGNHRGDPLNLWLHS